MDMIFAVLAHEERDVIQQDILYSILFHTKYKVGEHMTSFMEKQIKKFVKGDTEELLLKKKDSNHVCTLVLISIISIYYR